MQNNLPEVSLGCIWILLGVFVWPQQKLIPTQLHGLFSLVVMGDRTRRVTGRKLLC